MQREDNAGRNGRLCFGNLDFTEEQGKSPEQTYGTVQVPKSTQPASTVAFRTSA